MGLIAISALYACSKGPSSLTVTPPSLTITVGDVVGVKATVTPEDSKYGSISWSTSDESIASVNNGFITGKAPGSATITASTSGVSGSTSVTVKAKPVIVKSIILDKTSVTLIEDETVTLTASVSPENADDKSLSWSSSDESILQVTSNGNVKALKAGNAKVTVSSNDGGAKAECKVTVKPKQVAATSVVISGPEGSPADEFTIQNTKTLKLSATILPENTTEKTVTWEIEDSSIATISSSGLVTGVKSGTTTVTVFVTDHPSVSSSCRIIITEYISNSGLGNGSEIIIKN